jgi:hypothetical protein
MKPDTHSFFARFAAADGSASSLLVRLCVAAILLPFVAMIFFRFRADLPGGPQMQWSFLACLLLLFVFDDLVRLALGLMARRGVALPGAIRSGMATTHLGFAPLAALFCIDTQAGFALQGLQWAAGTLAVGAVLVGLNIGYAALLAGLGRVRAARNPH